MRSRKPASQNDEVVVPDAHESLVVAERADLVDPRVERLAPQPQRVGVVRSDLLEPLDVQPRRSPHRARHHLERGQVPAGEDVAPGSSRACGGRRRSAGRAARSSARRPGRRARARGRCVAKNVLELRLADRLEHLDRDELRVRAVDVAVVAVLDRDRGRRARPRARARARLVVLLARDRDAGDAAAALARRRAARSRPSRSRSRARGRPGPSASRSQSRRYFACCASASVWPSCSKIAHEYVSDSSRNSAEELVAEVVVVVDVALGAAQACSAGEARALAREARERRQRVALARPPRCCGRAARSGPAGRRSSQSPATYDSPSPTWPRSREPAEEVVADDLERCHSAASGSPKRRTVPSGSVSSSAPQRHQPEALQDHAARRRRRAARRTGAAARGARRCDAAASVIAPTPGPARTAACGGHGTRFSQSRSACQWISAVTCSGMQRVAGERARRASRS